MARRAAVVCALALMGGQNHVAVGAEWLVVSIGAGTVYVYGYPRARAAGASRTTLSAVRIVSGTVLYIAQIVGSILLVRGVAAVVPDHVENGREFGSFSTQSGTGGAPLLRGLAFGRPTGD